MRKTLLVLLIIIPTVIFAQRRNRYKYEWIGGVGMTNFLGDLGGANQIGTHFVKDWEWSATRPSLTGGLRYKNSRYIAFKGALSFAMLYGSDNLTQEPIRRNRNINFRSPVIELSTQVEFFVNKEKQGSLYRIKNARGARRLDLQGYLFAGIGFGGPKKYAPFTMSFPFGAGGKYGLDNKWSIGLEIGLHYTLSDYLDDVSGVYYDNNKILQAKGTAAAYLADPQLGNIPSQSLAGQERGHSNHADAFMFAVVNVNYKVMYRKRTRSKF
ncbi:MAG: hypothetical protein HYU69_03795 [Bacteroidetes bacterium]|nr:hypothetical protein [Bacteroidota bacterium]